MNTPFSSTVFMRNIYEEISFSFSYHLATLKVGDDISSKNVPILMLVDWSGGWATPGGLASQMRPWSEACRVKRLIGRPGKRPAGTEINPSYGDSPSSFITHIN